MAYMSARELLSGLPVKMAHGGPVHTSSGEPLYGKGATAADLLAAEQRVLGEIAADPSGWDVETAYNAILESGVTIDDALAAGVKQTTIDAIFRSGAPLPETFSTPSTVTSGFAAAPYAGQDLQPFYTQAQDYVTRLMDDGVIDEAERREAQTLATQGGFTFQDFAAAGVDPSILFTQPAAAVTPAVVTPAVVTPAAAVASFPQTQPDYVTPTVYQPLPDNTSVYAAGEESLDRTFRDSAPRTEVLDSYGNLTNFDYTPGASLRSATGSGYNWTPPTVTGRPRSLMGADLLARYTGGRSAADLRQLTTGLGNGRTYSDYTGVLQNPGAYGGGLSKSQLYSRMRGLDYQLDKAAAADREASTARGGISAYLAANPDIAASYEAQKEQLGGQSLEQFARNHYNTTGKAEMVAGKRGLFTLVADTPVYTSTQEDAFSGGFGGYEGEGDNYGATNWNQRYDMGKAGGVTRPFAHGGSVKKPQGFADGGTASADLEELNKYAGGGIKAKYQKWLDGLTPEQRAAFDASVEFGDQEYMGDVQRKLPPELRFGGEFGGISALGYGDGGDDRAQIRGYTTSDGVLPSVVGVYTQSGRRLGRDMTSAEALSRNSISNSDIVDYISAPPDYEDNRSKGISVFTPTSSEGKEGKYGSKEGYVNKKGTRYTYPETVQHELQHRGFDHPAFLDFLEETGRNKGEPLSSYQEHKYIDSSKDSNVAYDEMLRYNRDKGDFRNLRGAQDNQRELLSEFRNWLTPEKQEKYGIRTPVKASVPTETSALDGLINFIRGQDAKYPWEKFAESVMAKADKLRAEKPQGFADGGTASADLKALDPSDSLFITTDPVVEEDSDNVQRDIPLMEWDGVERPTPMQTESQTLLENIVAGYPKAINSVGNYFVRPDEQGNPSMVDPRQVGSDVASLGGALVDAVKEDDSFLKSRSIAEIAPITGELISGADALKFSNMANEARASGDDSAAGLYEQLVTLSAAGAVPLLGMGARIGRRATIKAVEEAIKKGALGDAAKMLEEIDAINDIGDARFDPPDMPEIIPTKDSVQSVLDSNYTMGREIGDQMMPMSKIQTSMSGAADDYARASQLAKDISSDGGYIERILVDTEGNVIEGQHRAEAMRALGHQEMPVTVLQDLTEVTDSLKANGLRPEHSRQVVNEVSDMLNRGDSSADYDVGEGLRDHYNTAEEWFKTHNGEALAGAAMGGRAGGNRVRSALRGIDPSLPKYQGMRDATVQHLKNKGIMSDEEYRVAELDGYVEDPKFTYSIDDSGSNSSYITLKKTTDYDEKYGVLDSDEYTIRFSDHSLPKQYAYDQNIYNVSEDYYDETINGKTLNDAIDYVDRLLPPPKPIKKANGGSVERVYNDRRYI
jgi:hypothetical protein